MVDSRTSQANNQYATMEVRGSNYSREVHVGFDTVMGQRTTLEKFVFNSTQGIPAPVLRQTTWLRSLRHPNIVKLLDVVHSRAPLSVSLAFEWLETDVKTQLQTQQQLDVFQAASAQRGLLSALEHCHSKRLIHGDIKPSNILLGPGYFPKLTGFGLCQEKRNHISTTGVQELTYRSPEVLLGSNCYSYSADIWSAGCVFFEMVFGYPPFQGSTELEQLQEICALRGMPDESTWPGVSSLPNFSRLAAVQFSPVSMGSVTGRLGSAGADLLASMLELCPERRATATSALQHPFFTFLAN